MAFAISFHVEDARWKKLLAAEKTFFTKLITQTLREFSLPKNTALAVVLMSDAKIRVLNRDFRHKDKATNVLSFPMIDDFNFPGGNPGPAELGDILLAFETIKREAADQGKTLRDHVAHLLVHGTLHLLGYDHMTKKDEAEMEALEIALLKSVKIPNPYE